MTARIGCGALVLAALLAAMTLAACGGGSSSDGAGKASTRDRAQDRRDVARLIKQGFGPNDKARSGSLDGTIDLTVEGVPRYKGPIELTATGGFELTPGSQVPDFNVDVGLVLNDLAIGGALVIADSNAFIELGSTGYKLPQPITQKIVAPAASRDNGLAKTAGMFFLRPDRWQRDGRIVGDADVDGVATEHATAGIRPGRFFDDVSHLVRLLTLLRVTEAVGLPRAISPRQRAALVRSVKSARGDVYLGKSDHVLRKAHLEGRLVVAKQDRALLGGMRGATLVGDIKVSEVGTAQHIGAPRQLGSYADLQLSLDALGEAIRHELHGT